MKRLLCVLACIGYWSSAASAGEAGRASLAAAGSAIPPAAAIVAPPAPFPLVGRSGDSYRYSNMFPAKDALDRLGVDNTEVTSTDDGKLVISRGGLFSGGSGVTLFRYNQLHRMRTTPLIRDFDLRTDISFDKAASDKDSLFGFLVAFHHGEQFDLLPNEAGMYLVVEITADGTLRTLVDRYVPAGTSVPDYYVAAMATFRDPELASKRFDESVAEGFRKGGETNAFRVVRKERQWQVFVNDKLAKTLEIDNLSPVALSHFPAYLVGGKTVVRIHGDAIDASYLNSRLREQLAKYPATLGTMTGTCAKPGITVVYGAGQHYGRPGILLGAPGFTDPEGQPLFFGYRVMENGKVIGHEPAGTQPVLFGTKRFELRGRPSIHLDDMSMGFRIIGDSKTVSRNQYRETISTEYCDLMVFRKPMPQP